MARESTWGLYTSRTMAPIPRRDVVAVIPALNCAPTIATLVSAVRQHLERVFALHIVPTDAFGLDQRAIPAHGVAGQPRGRRDGLVVEPTTQDEVDSLHALLGHG